MRYTKEVFTRNQDKKSYGDCTCAEVEEDEVFAELSSGVELIIDSLHLFAGEEDFIDSIKFGKTIAQFTAKTVGGKTIKVDLAKNVVEVKKPA